MGFTVGENDSIQHPVFGDAGYYANIAETDWSWCPLVADFDQDGNKDIIFTNGFPKDITDKDFANYRADVGNIAGGYFTQYIIKKCVPIPRALCKQSLEWTN